MSPVRVWADELVDLGGRIQANDGLVSITRILDAGGGSGHIAVRLARLGHSVVLCDVSDEMLAKAATRAADAGVTDAIDLRHMSIRAFADIADAEFDLVLCHAVLEWLEDPSR